VGVLGGGGGGGVCLGGGAWVLVGGLFLSRAGKKGGAVGLPEKREGDFLSPGASAKPIEKKEKSFRGKKGYLLPKAGKRPLRKDPCRGKRELFLAGRGGGVGSFTEGKAFPKLERGGPLFHFWRIVGSRGGVGDCSAGG